MTAYSSCGLLRRSADVMSGLVTATSMASGLPLQLGIDTSPGRGPEVGPRMPFCPSAGSRRVDKVSDPVVTKSPSSSSKRRDRHNVDGLPAQRTRFGLIKHG